MDTMTKTATKAVSGTKLAIATFAMFAAGSVALATVPLTSLYAGAVDGDNSAVTSVGYNKFANHQLFYKSTTKYNSGSKTDYCYTFPSTGKTYLMEGASNNGSFVTWQKNCAELNPANPGANFQCVDGACVNQVPCYNITGSGQKIMVAGNPAVWYLDGGVRHNFTKSEVYKSWFIDYSGVQQISPIVFDKYKEGGVVCLNSNPMPDLVIKDVKFGTFASGKKLVHMVVANEGPGASQAVGAKYGEDPILNPGGLKLTWKDNSGNEILNNTFYLDEFAPGQERVYDEENQNVGVKLLVTLDPLNKIVETNKTNNTMEKDMPVVTSTAKLEISGKQIAYTNTNILPNASNVEIFEYRFTASGSSVKINELPFMITNGDGVFESAFSNGLITIKLIDANGNTLGTKLVENNDPVINFTNLNYVIADDASQMLFIKLDVGNFSSEINGKNIKIILMPVENINAVGVLTGSMIGTSDLNVTNVASQAFTFVKTAQPAKLTVLSNSLPTNVLTNGVETVGKFSFIVSTAEDVKVNKITFNFLAALPTASSSIQTNNWELRSFPDGILLGSGNPSGSQIIFNNLNATIQKGSTLILQLSTLLTGITSNPGYTFKAGILSVDAFGNDSDQTAQVVGVPLWAPVLSN